MAALTLRRNFAWSFVGNVVYNLTQWLLLVALARVGTPSMVGQFALALAISAPVYLTVGLNLRAVRATDVRRVWSPHDYHRLRIYLNVLSLAVSLSLSLLVPISSGFLLVLAIVSLGKAAEATSQMLYGYFQSRERLDLVARSFLLRSGMGSLGFVGALLTTEHLAAACVGLWCGWSLVYVLHDRPQERRLLASDYMLSDAARPSSPGLRALARQAAPLGIDAGVGSIASNAPRYGVQAFMGVSQLGVFASLAYLGQVVQMVTGSLADTAIGRLAILADRRDSRNFVRLLALLIGFGMFVAGIAAALAWVAGEWFLNASLGSAFADREALVLLMLGAGVVTVQRCLGRGLQATHQYVGVLVVDVVTLVATIAAAALLIPPYGLNGAAVTLGVGFLVGSVLAVVLLARVVAGMRVAEPVGAA